jgi:hypothetical protein
VWAEIRGLVKTELMELDYIFIAMLPTSFQRRSVVVQMFLSLHAFVGLQLSDSETLSASGLV